MKILTLTIFDDNLQIIFFKSDEVPSARPGPNMIFLNMVKLDVFPAQVMIRMMIIMMVLMRMVVIYDNYDDHDDDDELDQA